MRRTMPSISGSSIVTMLAIGSIMYPAMKQAGYDLKFTLGAVMSGGTLGIIIPPSIPMIIYGLVTETSVTDLFAAGFGPGILLTIALSAYSVWFNWHMPTLPFDFALFKGAFKRGRNFRPGNFCMWRVTPAEVFRKDRKKHSDRVQKLT